MGRKPVCTASTAVARTQPLVVQPVMIKVSTCRLTRRDTRSVPKKHEAYFFTSRLSVARKSSRGSTSTPSVPAFRVATPFCLRAQMPASLKSLSWYITVEKMTGMPRACAIPSNVEIAAKHHVGIGERLDHIDHQERRPLPEPDPQAEAPLPEEFLVLIGVGHPEFLRF